MRDINRSLARSVVSRALRFGLQAPTRATAEALFSDQGRDALRRAAIVLDPEVGALRSVLEKLASVSSPSQARLQSTFERLFGHTAQGKVCPFETEYGRNILFQQAQELADIAGFYLAFGLNLSGETCNRPDHVACELEFLEFLSLKEAYALEVRDADMLKTTRAAMRKFMRNHLGRFGKAFGSSLAREDQGGTHGMLGEALVAFLELECRALDVPLGPEFLDLRQEEERNVPMACGEPQSELVPIRSPSGVKR
jgi:TorA maturation chaperone TorD